MLASVPSPKSTRNASRSMSNVSISMSNGNDTVMSGTMEGRVASNTS